jgi:hypothetical protein
LLPKQHLDIRFIIDHEDEKVHESPPDVKGDGNDKIIQAM